MDVQFRSPHLRPARSHRVDWGWISLVILFVLTFPLVTPRIYAVDSVEYFAYLHSLLFDGDLNFTDEYTYFHQLNPDSGIRDGLLEKHLFSASSELAAELDRGQVPFPVRVQFQWRDQELSPQARVEVQQAGSRWAIVEGNTRYLVWREGHVLNVYLDMRDPTTGLRLNIAPVGTALFWAPSYLLVHGGLLLARAAGVPVPAADGLSSPYILAVCYTSALYACAGLLLCYRLARRYVSSFAAALAVMLVWLATPAFFYSHVSPPWPHSTSLFVVALLVTVWHDTRQQRAPAQFFLVGLLAGLAALVREQDALFLFIPAVEGLVAVVTALRRREGQALLSLVGRYALLLAGAAVAFAPQLLVYRVLNGRFAPNPTVTGKFTWWGPHFFQVLGDPHYGLLAWSPVLVFALAGLLLLWRKDRLLAVALGVAFLAQVYIMGAYLTWMGPGSFGPRRLISCTVLFALGLAAFIAWAREKRVPAALLAGVGALLVAWNVGLIANWVLYPNDRQLGLVWDHLPQRVFVEIPRQGWDLIRRLLFERSSFYHIRGE